MQSFRLNSFRRVSPSLSGSDQIRLENLPQHFAGAPIYFGDPRMVINVLVQEFSQMRDSPGNQIIAVANQGRWLLARFV